MRTVHSIRRCVFIIVASLLAAPLSPRPRAERPEDRMRSILKGPGKLQADDVDFLKKHPKQLASFAENFLVEAGLGKRKEPPERSPLVRLMRMLEAADTVPTSVLDNDIVVKLVGIAALARVDTARALCEMLLQADYSSMVDIALEVSAERYPELLIKGLEGGKMREQEKAIVYLARNGVKDALPVLRKMARENSDPLLRAVAGLAIAKIEGKKMPDRFDKTTPQKFARSFVALVKKHPDRYAEEELEFWCNPAFPEVSQRWEEHLASVPDHEKKRELAERLQGAKWLAEALKEPDKSFVVQGRECGVLVEGKEVIRLYQDMFDQWRLAPMP